MNQVIPSISKIWIANKIVKLIDLSLQVEQSFSPDIDQGNF